MTKVVNEGQPRSFHCFVPTQGTCLYYCFNNYHCLLRTTLPFTIRMEMCILVPIASYRNILISYYLLFMCLGMLNMDCFSIMHFTSKVSWSQVFNSDSYLFLMCSNHWLCMLTPSIHNSRTCFYVILKLNRSLHSVAPFLTTLSENPQSEVSDTLY